MHVLFMAPGLCVATVYSFANARHPTDCAFVHSEYIYSETHDEVGLRHRLAKRANTAPVAPLDGKKPSLLALDLVGLGQDHR